MMDFLKSFFVSWTDEPEYGKIIVAKTHSAARYRYYQLSEVDCKYGEVLKNITSKCMGIVKPEHYYGDISQFERVKQYRSIPFAELGMAIDVRGKKGIITGGNRHSNLQVLFPGNFEAHNCHPHWETTYYNKDGEVIKDYKVISNERR